MNTTARQGQCAKCLSENLDYGVLEVQDTCIFYPYVCLDCKHEGKEWYECEHIEQE